MCAKKNHKTVFVVVLFLLLLSFDVFALDENKMRELAQLYYEEASAQYYLNNCRSAISNANRSRSLYSQLGEQDKVVEASLLISKINDCLMSEGDSFYVDAVQSYNDGNIFFDTERFDDAKIKYQDAKTNVLEANISYFMMEPSDDASLVKVNELYETILAQIRLIELNKADDYYIQANRYYFDYDDMGYTYPQYARVKEYAEDALEVYVRYNDSDGMYKAQKMLDRVVSDIEEIRIYAEGQKEMARDSYDDEDYITALNHYLKAKDAYTMIESVGDIAYCERQIEIVIELIEASEAQMRASAEQYYGDAEKAYLGHEYTEALTNLNKSKAIYVIMRDMARARKNPLKESEFQSLIDECNKFYSQVYSEVLNQDVYNEAGAQYDEAFDKYKEGKYEGALVLVTEAWIKYKQISSYGGMSNCERLNESIADRFTQMREAEKHYNISLSSYEVAFFENATYHANESLTIYKEIKRENETELVTKLITKINEGIHKKNTADQYYRIALDYNKVDQLDDAETNAKRAYDLYYEVNWGLGINQSTILLDSIREKKGMFRPIEALRLFVPIIIAVVIVVIGIRWYHEREQMRFEVKERERLKKHQEKEKKLRREQKVEDERKRRREMVEEERKTHPAPERDKTEHEDRPLFRIKEPKEPAPVVEDKPVAEDISAREKYALDEISREEFLRMQSGEDVTTRESAVAAERKKLKREPEDKSSIGLEREKISEKDTIMKEALKEERKKLSELEEQNELNEDHIENQIKQIKDSFSKVDKEKKDVSGDSEDK